MKKICVLTFMAVIFSSSIIHGATHHFFNDFTITQYSPAAGSSTVLNLTKNAPEIMYFENQSDLGLMQFLNHNDFAVYTKEIISGSITGGAADMLGITSESLFHFSGNAPGTMILSSFNGTNHLFDPLFSNYEYLVFDVQNIGNTAVNILPRIGPNNIYSNSSMYYAFNMFFEPVNVRTLAAGDTATFIFDLTVPGVVWDYANNPYNNVELLFQPATGTDFNVYVDNIGLSPIPEPGVFLLFALGTLFFRKYIKRGN